MISISEFPYVDRSTPLSGLLAVDRGQAGLRPGIVVFHEAPGLGPHVRRRISMLAELGYIALAADAFGDGGKLLEGEAMSARMTHFMETPGLMRGRVNAALDALRGRSDVDGARLGAIGYCMGGSCVLELARSGAEFAGAVCFHGMLGTAVPAQAGDVKARILVCAGAQDPLVPPEQVLAFEREMTAAGADWQLITYGGAAHSFTNADRAPGVTPGFAHHPAADRRSWRAMRDFFGEVFA